MRTGNKVPRNKRSWVRSL